MGLFSSIAQFFKRVFHKDSLASSQSPQLKHLEIELKNNPSQIYKNGFLTPSFAQAVHIVKNETTKVHGFLLETLYNPNKKIASRYMTSLIETGLTQEQQEVFTSLSYEDRKKEFQGKAIGMHDEIKGEQQKKITQVLSFFDTNEFIKIEKVIQKLDHLFEVCQFNYVSFLLQFDPLYENRKGATAEFTPLLVSDAETSLVDLYYLAYDFSLTVAEARAFEALCFVHNGCKVVDTPCFLQEIKTIHAAFKNVLKPEILQKLIYVAKGKVDVSLQVASYNRSLIEPYKEKLKKRFAAETKRISAELQDEKNAEDITLLFDQRKLIPLQGYTEELSLYLQTNATEGFLHIIPLSIINTFLLFFFSNRIINYLNRIIVEGFFTNPSFKAEFSSAVFACSEINTKLRSFENSFSRGQANDSAVLRGNALDGQQNMDLLKKLSYQIDTINHDAQYLMQEIMDDINQLAQIIDTLLSEAKKSNPSDISNIKMLISSVRNREDAEDLENHFPKWRFFIDIMHNYVIIKEKDRKKIGS